MERDSIDIAWKIIIHNIGKSVEMACYCTFLA